MNAPARHTWQSPTQKYGDFVIQKLSVHAIEIHRIRYTILSNLQREFNSRPFETKEYARFFLFAVVTPTWSIKESSINVLQ